MSDNIVVEIEIISVLQTGGARMRFRRTWRPNLQVVQRLQISMRWNSTPNQQI